MEELKPNDSIAKRKIEFPEIEPVKDEAETEKSKPRMGLGKKRFTSLAVKVMAQLYQNNEETIVEENNDKSEKTQEENDGDKKSHTAKTTQPARKISRVGKKNNFASLVRLAKYKKMATKSTPGELDPVEEEVKVQLPQKPRFSATLSPEAQYAMLKGYEDILLTNLKHDVKKEKEKQSGTLYRVKTPHHTVTTLHLNGLEQDKVLEEENTESDGQIETVRKRAWDIRPAPYYGKLYRIDSKDDVKKNNKRDDNSKALLPKKMGSLQLDEKAVPKDKQLMLTHRFHCAMDILDKMRESQGMMVTSPRYKRRTINPADNYNAWSKEWSREFKLEYR